MHMNFILSDETNNVIKKGGLVRILESDTCLSKITEQSRESYALIIGKVTKFYKLVERSLRDMQVYKQRLEVGETTSCDEKHPRNRQQLVQIPWEETLPTLCFFFFIYFY